MILKQNALCLCNYKKYSKIKHNIYKDNNWIVRLLLYIFLNSKKCNQSTLLVFVKMLNSKYIQDFTIHTYNVHVLSAHIAD